MKKGVLSLAFLLSLPAVLAEGTITQGFNFLFGQTNNEIVLKLGILIVLIALFKAGFAKLNLFPEHPNMNVMLAGVISLIAIKFMPATFSTGIGTIIWIVALILLPYTLFGMFIESKFWKAALTLLSIGGIYYFISSTGGPSLYGSRYPYLGFIRGSEIFDDIYYKATTIEWLVPFLLVAAVIVLLFVWKKHGGSVGGGGSGQGILGGWVARSQARRLARIEANKERDVARIESGGARKKGLFSRWREKKRVRNQQSEEIELAEREEKHKRKMALKLAKREAKINRIKSGTSYPKRAWEGVKGGAGLIGKGVKGGTGLLGRGAKGTWGAIPQGAKKGVGGWLSTIFGPKPGVGLLGKKKAAQLQKRQKISQEVGEEGNKVREEEKAKLEELRRKAIAKRAKILRVKGRERAKFGSETKSSSELAKESAKQAKK
jgi:hypothetical protein